jgi:lysophospholipase L1-like esterase
MKLEQGQKLLFIGDSITDADRNKEVRDGGNGALGKGYVAFVDALLQSVYPELGIRTVNKGINGHTVRNLKDRWHEDVINHNPDWLSVMIGINDVWRQYDAPLIKEYHVYIEEYEETLKKLVKETRPQVKGLILMSPFYLESNEQDDMRRTMDQYGSVVKKIASENDCLYVDTQAALNKILKTIYPAALAWDRVHPNATGHMVMARAFLQVLDFDWNKQ